jgi:endonuclease YncB( thermonuclease family)
MPRLLALVAVIFIATGQIALSQTLSGLASVQDGDTIYIENEHIRLTGVDAPELTQRCADGSGDTWPCGEAAFRLLVSIADRQRTVCKISGKDRYDRWLARCTVAGADIGAAVVARGLAWAYRRYSDDYAALEDRARSRGVGVWRAPTPTPWDYRTDLWARAGQGAPNPACPIKGNISKSGVRIYHTPWSRWYERTRIAEQHGERWFCSEAEALAAGWRGTRR